MCLLMHVQVHSFDGQMVILLANFVICEIHGHLYRFMPFTNDKIECLILVVAFRVRKCIDKTANCTSTVDMDVAAIACVRFLQFELSVSV